MNEESVRQIGVGPYPKPWPDDARFDPELLANGDTRNVSDEYRYWKNDAIVAELDKQRFGLHVAIENWQHDFNIGTIVRNANAFNVAAVHIIGKRQWNRRGAMVTDRYLHVLRHASVKDFTEWASPAQITIIGFDNVPGSTPLSETKLPREAVLVFGQEGPGLSEEMQAACESVIAIEQFGSTRSVNVGVASGIAMYAWLQHHVLQKHKS